MGLLIDSSVFIEIERSNQPLEVLRTLVPNEDIAVASVTIAEILTGAFRADTASRRINRQRFVDLVMESFPLYSYTPETALIHARIWADLASKGQTVGGHDLQIAATAIQLGFGVMTRNARDFQRIPTLRVYTP